MTDDDGWGQPTAVYGGGTRHAGRAFAPPSGRPAVRPQPHGARPANATPTTANGSATDGSGYDPWGYAAPTYDPSPPPSSPAAGEGWSPGGPASRAQERSNRATERSIAALREHRRPERGLPWWAALLVLVAVAGIGGYIDTSGGALQIQGGFNIGIVVASALAILLVKRSHMFPVVIAPPIVYSLAAVLSLYLHGGVSNHQAVIDAASNYLVYGFPAIAAASACVLIVGGVRLIIGK